MKCAKVCQIRYKTCTCYDLPCLALYLYRKFGPCQLSCLGGKVGKALGLESRVSWVRIPPEAANFSLEKRLPQAT